MLKLMVLAVMCRQVVIEKVHQVFLFFPPFFFKSEKSNVLGCSRFCAMVFKELKLNLNNLQSFKIETD